jgi:hypothetical protein
MASKRRARCPAAKSRGRCGRREREREGSAAGSQRIFGDLRRLVAAAADHESAEVSTWIHGSRHASLQVKPGVGRWAGCGSGPSAFFEGGANAAGAPREPAITTSAARSRELPDRANAGGSVPVWRTHRTPSGPTTGQAYQTDAQQVEAKAGRGAQRAGQVSAEDAAILAVAEACDGTTTGIAARRIAALPGTKSTKTHLPI